MANLISVGCKLPQGLIIEVGYKLVPGGAVQGEGYRRVTLAGANQHSIISGSLRTPSPKDLRPGLTHGVDEAVYDQWVKDHRDSNIVRNGLVFKAKDAAEATAQAVDVTQQKTGLEAVDPSKHPGITKATTDDDAKV